MSRVNNYRPHLFVLPEDDANRQLANGFHLHDAVAYERMRVLPPARGWVHVVDEFLADEIPGLERFVDRLFVLLLDFDDNLDRLDEIKAKIPPNLRERVFIIGAKNEPEDLKRHWGAYEAVGRLLAEDCVNNTSQYWSHYFLSNNAAELDRLRRSVRHFLIK